MCGDSSTERRSGIAANVIMENKNLYELDVERSDILTVLDIEDGGEDFDAVLKATEEQQHLEKERIEYYKKLMEEGQEIVVTFTSSSRGKLSAMCNGIQLLYDLGLSSEIYSWENMLDRLKRKYLLKVLKIDEAENRVYLGSEKDDQKRKRAFNKIDEKLAAGEEVYLRGQITGLQRESGKYEDRTAAYVNINGIGIIGIIPCSKWSCGYKPTNDFRKQIENNIGSLVGFRITGKIRINNREVYMCNRRDYLKAIGQDPWKILKRNYRPKMNVRVAIVDKGHSDDGSYFCSMEGLKDLNFLCYPAYKSNIKPSEIKIGDEYFGFIQKMDPDRKFARVRLTEKIEDTAPVGMGK